MEAPAPVAPAPATAPTGEFQPTVSSTSSSDLDEGVDDDGWGQIFEIFNKKR